MSKEQKLVGNSDDSQFIELDEVNGLLKLNHYEELLKAYGDEITVPLTLEDLIFSHRVLRGRLIKTESDRNEQYQFIRKELIDTIKQMNVKQLAKFLELN